MTQLSFGFGSADVDTEATALPSLVRVSHPEKSGAVYTRPWVVELMLDLAGYTVESDLTCCLAVEPAAGEGAFFIPMIRRLIASWRRRERPLSDCAAALLAYELDAATARTARQTAIQTLRTLGIPDLDAVWLAEQWVRTGDYLVDARTLPPADFIIGNPPYIRLEDVEKRRAAAYRMAYLTMKGRADIYIAFFEAALRQLKPGGVCAYICADRWMLNQYGAELRRYITAGYSVETVVEMHTADAFMRGVSAYPAISVIRRGMQGPAVVARAGQEAETAGPRALYQSLEGLRRGLTTAHMSRGLRAARVEQWFAGTDPWPSVSPERLALLNRLEGEFYPLQSAGTATRVGIGVATGLDEVFITTDADLVETTRLIPLAMASDLSGGTLTTPDHYLVDPWGAHGLVNLAQFPRLAAYLERRRAALERRHVAQRRPDQWYRTIDRVNHAIITEPKLYISDIMNRLDPVLDAGRTYPHHNLYVVQSAGWNLEVLGGLLMSAVGQFFVECYGVRMRGGYLRFQAQYLRRIRVPRPQDLSDEQAAGLVAAFRRRDHEWATRLAMEIYRIENWPANDHD